MESLADPAAACTPRSSLGRHRRGSSRRILEDNIAFESKAEAHAPLVDRLAHIEAHSAGASKSALPSPLGVSSSDPKELDSQKSNLVPIYLYPQSDVHLNGVKWPKALMKNLVTAVQEVVQSEVQSLRAELAQAVAEIKASGERTQACAPGRETPAGPTEELRSRSYHQSIVDAIQECRTDINKAIRRASTHEDRSQIDMLSIQAIKTVQEQSRRDSELTSIREAIQECKTDLRTAIDQHMATSSALHGSIQHCKAEMSYFKSAVEGVHGVMREVGDQVRQDVAATTRVEGLQRESCQHAAGMSRSLGQLAATLAHLRLFGGTVGAGAARASRVESAQLPCFDKAADPSSGNSGGEHDRPRQTDARSTSAGTTRPRQTDEAGSNSPDTATPTRGAGGAPAQSRAQETVDLVAFQELLLEVELTAENIATAHDCEHTGAWKGGSTVVSTDSST